MWMLCMSRELASGVYLYKRYSHIDMFYLRMILPSFQIISYFLLVWYIDFAIM